MQAAISNRKTEEMTTLEEIAPILTEASTALLGQFGVTLASLPKSGDLLARTRARAEKLVARNGKESEAALGRQRRADGWRDVPW
jgi:hypothetical protein